VADPYLAAAEAFVAQVKRGPVRGGGHLPGADVIATEVWLRVIVDAALATSAGLATGDAAGEVENPGMDTLPPAGNGLAAAYRRGVDSSSPGQFFHEWGLHAVASAARAPLLAELHGLRQLFDLQWDRSIEAAERWRAEDPTVRALQMPDLGELLTWLMADADKARAEVARLQAGPCGDSPPPLAGITPPGCTLAYDHRGMHTDGTATWTNLTETTGARLDHEAIRRRAQAARWPRVGALFASQQDVLGLLTAVERLTGELTIREALEAVLRRQIIRLDPDNPYAMPIADLDQWWADQMRDPAFAAAYQAVTTVTALADLRYDAGRAVDALLAVIPGDRYGHVVTGYSLGDGVSYGPPTPLATRCAITGHREAADWLAMWFGQDYPGVIALRQRANELQHVQDGTVASG
jgi:hypothetical protein